MHKIFASLNSIYPMSHGLIEYLSKGFEYTEVKKDNYILKEGHVCRYMYFIDEGLVRCSLNRGDNEICAWFQVEGYMVIAIDSFYDQKPSAESIKALEDCKLYRISFADLQHVYRTYLESNIFRSVLTEHYYRIVWKVFCNTRLNKASDRYKFFIDNFPEWVNRVPEQDIAEFLGITPTHFSRAKWG